LINRFWLPAVPDFHSEQPGASSDSHSDERKNNIMQNQFRLDDLLARDVVPQWFEGVALVQLVCRHLRGQGLDKSSFPRPDHILIATGGSLTITGGSDEKPVEAAAHVLGLMLGSDVPVRLRLSISQATATGGYATLAEFSEALAYFERPNPEAIVESFRHRALTAARREIAPPVRLEAPRVNEKQSATLPPAPPSRVSRLAVIVATFLGLVCASIWAIHHGLTDVLKPKVVMAETAERTEMASEPTTNDVIAPARAPRRESTSIAAPAVRPVEQRRSEEKPALDLTPQLQVYATTVSYSYPESLAPAAVANFPATTQVELVTSDDVVLVDRDQNTLGKIYSQADTQVTVPVTVYPKLPHDAPGTPVTGRTILELTIAADGLVERVKMLTAPRNIHEFMLLSAAKAWRFEPARLNGRPVRFRQTLTLTPMP
jgi:hypothetical protein